MLEGINNKLSSDFFQSLILWGLISLTWIIYVIANLMVVNYPIFSGIIKFIIDNGAILILATLFFVLWHKAEKSSAASFIFLLFAIAHCSLFTAATIYNLRYNILHAQHSKATAFWSSINDIFFTSYLLFGFLSFVLILLCAKISAQKSIRIYIPIILIAGILFILSFYSIKWNMGVSTTATVYDFARKILQIACLIIVSLCITTAKNKGFLYLATGFFISIVTEIIIAFGVGYRTNSLLETGWVLGELITFYGLVSLVKDKDLSNNKAWIASPDSIRAQAAYWSFIILLATSALTVLIAKVINSWQFEAVLITCSIFVVIFSNLIAKKITSSLQKPLNMIDRFQRTEQVTIPVVPEKPSLAEFKQLENFLTQTFLALQEKRELEKTKLEEHAKFKNAAKQVAHDIRSPLAALDLMMERVAHLPEEDRLIIRNAAQRINDITNNLLSRYSEWPNNHAINDIADVKTTELFISMLESIISEKRIQYVKKPIEFIILSTSEVRGLFADVNLSEFKRVLSNIINNAVEAIGDNKGKVELVLNQNQNNILLSIKDNGKGIPKEKLYQMFIAKSSDKKDGHGLGLPYAKECIERWRGQIAIESMEGLGATINISLPKAPDPEWFAPYISLKEGDALIVLDDDTSIHDVWRSRLEQLGDKFKDIFIKDFLTPDSLIQWYASSCRYERSEAIFNATIPALFLIDYELVGYALTGLDVIEQLKIADKSILVTSRFEDLKIRERCEKLGLKMIPKSFSPYIPIELGPKSVAPENSEINDSLYCVFLDDDSNTTRMWSRVAEDCGKQIAVFNDIKEFKAYVSQCPKDMLIYLDSDLSCGLRGEDIAKELNDLGYNNIYLATGYDASDFRLVTWIKGVVGKRPPFVKSNLCL